MTFADTPCGSIEGVTLANGTLRFMNVPYAEPPVGVNRFRPPIPRRPWHGLWDGTRPGATPAQRDFPSLLLRLGSTPGQISGDDVLNLNIFTPSLEGSYPVAVYLPGGGFSGGSGALRIYDGAKFARDGIVLVSINYRVGAEGFLLFEEGHANLGFDDQIAALRWVQDNIAAFGGDPGRVTIFGQSAGGASVAHLVSMPETAGLFHRSINQSGTVFLYGDPQNSLEFTQTLARSLDVPASVAGFSTIAPDDLVRAVERVLTDRWAAALQPRDGRGPVPGLSLVPMVDPVRAPFCALDLGPVLDPGRAPWHATGDLHEAFPNRVPVLAGFTAEELLLYTWENPVSIDEPDALAAIAKHCENPSTVLTALRDCDPELSLYDVVRKVRETQICTGQILLWLEAARGANLEAWGYEFGWRTGAFNGLPRAFHGIELPFVFDNLGTAHALEMTGDGAPQELADAVHREWVDFMQRGHLDRKMYSGPESMRWFDTATREERANTTAVTATLLAASPVTAY